jgi:serine/threonine protein phosphatase PrpC
MSLGRSAARTDPGRRRLRNEDAYVCDPPLFAVADGMGGAQAGELASSLAAAALRGQGVGGATAERIVALIQEANRRVFERAIADASASGMGTTITVALVEGDRVVFGHVGDSRAYLIRHGQLHQVTDDHSLVAELVRSGRLSPEEAESHPQRSVITRVLGTDPEVDVDTIAIDGRPGDLFLLCSDGLSSMVDERTILDITEGRRQDLERAAEELVAAANRGGGEDNITAILFELLTEGDTQTLPAPPPLVPRPDEPDEADTLTELDGVPTIQTPSSPDDTMIVSRERLEAALEARASPTEASEPPAASEPLDATASPTPGAEPEAPLEAPVDEAPTAGFWRRLLALLVIAGLSALIVVLVLWGLAR